MYNKILNLNNFEYNYYTRRAPVYVNIICSYKCIFCYYKNTKIINNNIYNYLDYLKLNNILDLDFTGGEPTQDSNLLNYIKYAKNNNFRRIAVITNGRNFSNINYLKECINSGLNEIVFSVHGYDDKSHDNITQVKDSFKYLLKAIDNAKNLNLLIRFNTTICEYNIDNLYKQVINLINYYEPICQNYIFMNFYNDNQDYNFNLDYEYISDKIKNSIDLINKNKIKYITVRYAPFCYFTNYEKYILNKYQHIYDYFDWDLNFIDINNKIINNSKIDNYNQANIIRKKYYYKNKLCYLCKYAYICDGIPLRLKNKIKMKAIFGDHIKDPVYFIKNYHSKERYERIIEKF
jgi:MoaA/NifB/PqqE/SkfB family radical SAM enzyme